MRPTNRQLEAFSFPVRRNQKVGSSSQADKKEPPSSGEEEVPEEEYDAEDEQSVEEMEEVQQSEEQRLQVLEDHLNVQLQHEQNPERMQLLQQDLSTVELLLQMPKPLSYECQILLQQLEDLNSPRELRTECSARQLDRLLFHSKLSF